VADDEEDHPMEITALSISPDRKLALTGAVGSAPVAFIWDTTQGTK
jgi:hypothetical protein